MPLGITTPVVLFCFLGFRFSVLELWILYYRIPLHMSETVPGGPRCGCQGEFPS